MLLNLSNHPSKNWSSAQLEAAKKQYQSVTDLPFPQISPQENTEDVVLQAKAYLKKITTDYPTTTAVHLAGEMTFTVALIRMLQKNHISVVCSTTERVVIEEKDGKKTMQFSFCRFRAYPN